MSYDDRHTVTLMWEPNCANAEAGLCEEADCDPDTDGGWMAACDNCGFLVMAPDDQYTGLWAFATRHEQDPGVGRGMERLA
ncbi:hypothetical protein AB0J28_48960 [Streptosporangium canum]|uniref:hypothetical protein n=1 Tax=Streptosporangium canum TaxID=324952 RepID=UPI00342432BD